MWPPDPGDARAFSQLHLLVLPASGRRVGPLGNRCVGLDRPPRRPQLVRYRCLGRSGRNCLFARLGDTVSSRRAEASATSPRMDPMILVLLPQRSWPGPDHEPKPVFFLPPQINCGATAEGKIGCVRLRRRPPGLLPAAPLPFPSGDSGSDRRWGHCQARGIGSSITASPVAWQVGHGNN
jgi:hypothetical protein